MSNILLIEDESSVAGFIRKGLSEEGYNVAVAFSAADGLRMATDSSFQLILLDIMLQDANGVELCRDLRRKGVHSPILFLTALGSAENIAHALDSGGDDYLVKPFKFIELNARIKALLRRSDPKDAQSAGPDSYQIGDLTVNDDAKSVERSGKPIVLTATEYRLLLALVRNKGRVLSRVDLLESVWDMSFNMGTNVVDVYINYLRKKIDLNHDAKLIHTVIGMGYVLKEQ